jgi:hypothetical protein
VAGKQSRSLSAVGFGVGMKSVGRSHVRPGWRRQKRGRNERAASFNRGFGRWAGLSCGGGMFIREKQDPVLLAGGAWRQKTPMASSSPNPQLKSLRSFGGRGTASEQVVANKRLFNSSCSPMFSGQRQASSEERREHVVDRGDGADVASRTRPFLGGEIGRRCPKGRERQRNAASSQAPQPSQKARTTT